MMKTMLRNTFILAFFCTSGFGQTFSVPEDFHEKANAYLDAVSRVGIFSGNVLIAHGHDVLLEESVGYASRRLGVPNTSDTRFRLGSITKSFTAIGILQLMEQGELTLDDPLSHWFPDFPFADQILIRHLLSHSSGLKRDIRFPDKSERYSMEELITLAHVDSLLYTPGSRSTYSNCGYIFLQSILETESGMPYEDYLITHILQPLQLRGMGLEMAHFPPARLADGYAAGANPEGTYDIQEVYLERHGYPEAVGALFGTARELWQFTRHIGDAQLLSAATWEQALSPQVEQEYGYQWGFGFNVYESNGLLVYNHNDRTTGFRGGYFYYPEQEITMVVLANNSFAERDRMVDAFERMLTGKRYYQPEAPQAIELPAEKKQAYVGTYDTGEFTFSITERNGQLYLASHGDPPSRIHAYAEDAFFCEYFDLKLAFERKRDVVTAVEWRYQNRPTQAKKVE
ncbi:MAG TPA: hypothetical protein DCP28_32160 [Cytophagales bacterium]|nr:hypothetical protein [Cytophagales bacterium]